MPSQCPSRRPWAQAGAAPPSELVRRSCVGRHTRDGDVSDVGCEGLSPLLLAQEQRAPSGRSPFDQGTRHVGFKQMFQNPRAVQALAVRRCKTAPRSWDTTGRERAAVPHSVDEPAAGRAAIHEIGSAVGERLAPGHRLAAGAAMREQGVKSFRSTLKPVRDLPAPL